VFLTGGLLDGAVLRSDPMDEEIRHKAASDWFLFVNDQVRIDANADPLMWWRTIGSTKYPYVEPIARKTSVLLPHLRKLSGLFQTPSSGAGMNVVVSVMIC